MNYYITETVREAIQAKYHDKLPELLSRVNLFDVSLNKLPNLTYESCINILNGLYDFAGNGETPSGTQGQLKVHQNFLNIVGDEISIGTLKGWKITV